MPPRHSRSPALLLHALFLSPALLALHACDGRKEISSNKSVRPSLISKAHEPARGSRSRGPNPKCPAPIPTDPQAAFEALTANNASAIRDTLRARPLEWKNRLAPFYRAWGKLDPESALGSALAEGKLSLAASLGVIEGWTLREPEVARAWIDGQESKSLRIPYARSLIKAWPRENLGDLASWSESNSDLIPQVAARWSREDPREAARWLNALSSGPHHRRATDHLFRRWAQDDPEAAGHYLLATPEFPHRDDAVAAFAVTVMTEDPEAAGQWAREISNPDLRQHILMVLPTLQSSPVSPLEIR